MNTSGRKCTLVAGLVALLVMGVALPGHAGYTKLYRFINTTGGSQSSVNATTNGLETITNWWSSPGTWFPPNIGYTVSGGVFCTTLTYGGPAIGSGTSVAITWETADSSCRLRDLRWGDGQVIVPAVEGGVPGGGMVFYDHPYPGCLTVVITNDLIGPEAAVIDLSEVGFGISGYGLTPEELAQLSGLVELRVADIDEDIDVLAAEVEYYGAVGEVSGPSANSLLKKLERAAAYKHLGLDEHLAGDPDGAIVFWARAAKQMTNFISEVTAAAQKGNLALVLYNRWVVDGDGDIVPAPDIRDALLALPEGQALQSLPPVEPPELLEDLGLSLANYEPWPAFELDPGEFTAFVVCGLDLGAGFIMGGTLLDEGGDVALEWMEQSVAEPTVIASATATPEYLWPPSHSEVAIDLEVVLLDDTYTWYVADVISNQPEQGTGDGDTAPDWWVDPADQQSLWLRAERSGDHPEEVRIYIIVLSAVDTDGNHSAPYMLGVAVDHDEGA